MSTRPSSRRDVPAPISKAAQPIDENVALMLDVLGQPPVIFHRAYVGIADGIAGALWLSFAMGRRAQAVAALQEADQTIVEPIWFSFSREDCEEGTGLTRHQQDSARRELRQRNVVLERRRSTTEVAIDTRRLGQLLMAQTRSQWGIAVDATAPGADSALDQSQADSGTPEPHDQVSRSSEAPTS
jgi:hypothetical protein